MLQQGNLDNSRSRYVFVVSTSSVAEQGAGRGEGSCAKRVGVWPRVNDQLELPSSDRNDWSGESEGLSQSFAFLLLWKNSLATNCFGEAPEQLSLHSAVVYIALP
jgi:hypothetical protein